jgi:hypothetical protein
MSWSTPVPYTFLTQKLQALRSYKSFKLVIATVQYYFIRTEYYIQSDLLNIAQKHKDIFFKIFASLFKTAAWPDR